MHPLRPLRKGIEQARPTTEPHPQPSGLGNRAVRWGLQLAPIAEIKTGPTGEGSVDAPDVEPGGASAAAVAPKPGSIAAEMTPGPRDRHPLTATGPHGRSRRAPLVAEAQRIVLDGDFDLPRWLAADRNGARQFQPRSQEALAVQVSHVERKAIFARPSFSTSVSGHFSATRLLRNHLETASTDRPSL